MQLVQEWLKYAQLENVLTDIPNTCGLPNYKNFKEHRHDQSIFTNLLIKYNIPCFRDPTKPRRYSQQLQLSEYENKMSQTYGRIMIHHRGMMLISFFHYLKSLGGKLQE